MVVALNHAGIQKIREPDSKEILFTIEIRIAVTNYNGCDLGDRTVSSNYIWQQPVLVLLLFNYFRSGFTTFKELDS